MAKKDAAKLSRVSVSLPFGIGEAEWKVDGTERRAAWSLYVELVTRVSLQKLDLDGGLLREAVASLHDLFAVTRTILIQAGPDVGAGRRSVGGIALAVLNHGLRPFVSKWHPLLVAWEASADARGNPRDHERKWPSEIAMRSELNGLREGLAAYAEALAHIAGVELG